MKKQATKKQPKPAFKNIDEVLNGLMEFAETLIKLAEKK